MMAGFDTPIGQVRLLISDVDPDRQVLTDDMISGYLTLENDHVRLAAAAALDAIASSETLLSKVITTQDRSTNGAAVAESLRQHAAALRARAAADDEAADMESFFTLIPTTSSGRGEGEERTL